MITASRYFYSRRKYVMSGTRGLMKDIFSRVNHPNPERAGRIEFGQQQGYQEQIYFTNKKFSTYVSHST